MVAGGPGTTCLSSNTSTLTPTISCNDDALVTATLSVQDPYNPAVTSDASILVYNQNPVLGSVPLPSMTVPLGGSVTVTVAFTDAGSNDTHTAQIRWFTGDTFGPMAVTDLGGSGSATASHCANGTGLAGGVDAPRTLPLPSPTAGRIPRQPEASRGRRVGVV